MMKKSFFAVLAVILPFISCSHDGAVPVSSEGVPGSDSLVTFTAAGCFDAEVTTRASVVASLPSFYCIATNGSSEALSWGPVTFTKGSDSNYTGGRYWPTTNPSYHFYASNLSLAHSTSGCTVSPTGNDTDVVVAYLASPTYQSSNALTFGHIFCRVGTVSLTANVSGASVTLSSITLKSAVTSGTYNLKSGSWSSKGTGSDQTLTNGSNDLYVVPGTYTLSVKYTYTKGDYTETLTKTASVTLEQGKVNSISGTLSGDPNDIIKFTVSINAWGSNSISVTL